VRLARPTTGNAEAEAVRQVLCAEQPWLSHGPRVEEFETKCRAYLGGRWAVALSSATAGLHLTFEYYRRTRKVEYVLMPSFTFVATANAAVAAGLKPLFVDVDPRTFQVGGEQLEHLRAGVLSKALLCPVLYGGYAGSVPDLEDWAASRGLPLVWDAAHAFGSEIPGGARVGSTRAPAVFSFYPSKNLTACEGGMVAGHEEYAIADYLDAARNQGQSKHIWRQTADKPWEVPFPGYNYRMSEVHAAIALVQLGSYEAALVRRRAINEQMRAALPQFDWQATDEGSNVHLLAARLATPAARQSFIGQMERRGVEVGIQYPAVHQMSAFGMQYVPLPVTDVLSERVVTLPSHHGLSDVEVKLVIEAAQDSLEVP